MVINLLAVQRCCSRHAAVSERLHGNGRIASRLQTLPSWRRGRYALARYAACSLAARCTRHDHLTARAARSCVLLLQSVHVIASRSSVLHQCATSHAPDASVLRTTTRVKFRKAEISFCVQLCALSCGVTASVARAAAYASVREAGKRCSGTRRQRAASIPLSDTDSAHRSLNAAQFSFGCGRARSASSLQQCALSDAR